MLDKAQYIVVEGPIGAGKTSLAKRLAEHLKVSGLLERPDDNPFLSRFFQDRPRHALQTRLSFLFQHIDLLREAFRNPRLEERRVSDFLFEKDDILAALDLTEEEYPLYRRIFDLLSPEAPTPDLVIYLQAEPDVLMERVRQRNPEMGKKLNEDYLARVARHYADFFYRFDAAPVFTINAQSLDLEEGEEDFLLLVERLRNMRSYREFFGYSN